MAERVRFAVRVALVSAAFTTLVACGKTGDLYLPGERPEVVTRPAPPPDPSGGSNSPQTVDSPQTPASPAPEVTSPDGTAPAAKDDADSDKKKDGDAAAPR